jgi:hypothetical protein
VLLLAGALGLPPVLTAAAQSPPQDWARRACKTEVGNRIADLPLSEIAVEFSLTDGDGNTIINWRSTRGSSGFCRVSRQGDVTQFKVEEMARPAGPGTEPDAIESGYWAACRAEAASRVGVREADVTVHMATRNAEDIELDWRTRRGSTGTCRIDRRGRITEFETYRHNDGGSAPGAPGGAPAIPYAQKAAYDSGYSWGQEDNQRSRTRSYRRYGDLYTSETEEMFRKGYEDGFDRRPKDYRMPSGPAPAPSVAPGRYIIEFTASGKILDLRLEDGTTVQQWSSALLLDKKNQHWDIEDAGNGYFYIRSAANGKALAAGGQTNGAPVQASAWARAREQQWRIKVLENGEVQIISGNGLALDLPGAKNDNGVKPHLWQEHGRENQRFRLKPVS